MNINLKLLQTFLLIAEHRSFRKAAEASNRTTSAMSMQLKHLEEQAGIALFRRTSHDVDLTPEGERLLVKTRLALCEINAGLKELRDAALRQRGLVTLASSPSIASTILPRVLLDFGTVNPDIVVRVQELSAEGTLKAVGDQAVDFGVGPAAVNQGDFNFTNILYDEICAVVPSSHVLARKQCLPFRSLRGVPCISLSNFSALRQSIDNAARESGMTLNIQYEVQQIPTVLTMVAAGLGIGIAPSISLGSILAMGLHALPLVQPAIRRDISLIVLKGRTPPEPARLLMQALSQSARVPKLEP